MLQTEKIFDGKNDENKDQYNFASRWQSLITLVPVLQSYHEDILLSFGEKSDGLYNILEYTEVFPEVLEIE